MKREKNETLAMFDDRCVGRWHALYEYEAMKVTNAALWYLKFIYC